MKKLAICTVACAALLLSSCASSKVEDSDVPTVNPTPAFAVMEGSWETAEFTKDGNAVTGSTASITFSEPDYQIAGNNGVNQYFGSVKIDGTSFDATESLGETMMAGSEEAMAFASAYMKAFIHADTIGQVEDNLVIFGPDSKIVYEFNGEEFETVFVQLKGKEVTGGKATLTVMPVYKVNGTSGVNTYNGEVAFLNGQFKANTEEFALTKMMGAPEAQNFENEFLATLGEAKTLDIEDGMLKLSSDNATIYFNGVMTIAE